MTLRKHKRKPTCLVMDTMMLKIHRKLAVAIASIHHIFGGSDTL